MNTSTGPNSADSSNRHFPRLQSSRSARRVVGLASLGLGLAIPTALRAQSAITWDGSASTDWTDGTNWVGDVAPTSTNIADFSSAFTSQPNAGTTSIAGLTFGSTSAVTLSGTSLTIGSSGIVKSGSSNDTISSGVVLGAGQTWNIGSGTFAVSGVVSGANSLTKSGSGTLTLSGANTFTGGLTINAGTVSVSANNHLGANASTVTLDGGTLRTTTGFANTHAVTIGSNGGTINHAGAGTATLRFDTANTLLGSGQLTITGNGTVPLATTAHTGVVVLNQSNTYNGHVIVQEGGLLEYANASGMGSGATVTLNNLGTLSATGVAIAHAVTVNTGGVLAFQNNANGSFTGPITLNGAGTVRLQNWYNATVQNGLISGNITGAGSLAINSGTNTGATLTLSGTNTYTGNTTITASTVAITGNSTGLTGTFVVGVNPSLNANPGTLTLNGNTGSLASNAKINGAGGTFNYQGATAGSTLDATGYTFGGGDLTIQSTYGTNGNTQVTLAGVTRSVGSTLNFNTSGGTNGTTNKIVFSSAPTAGQVINQGLFFGGSNYAAYDAGGFVRAYNYGTDANGVTSTGGTTLGSVTGKDVDLTTAAVTAQTTDSINTLRLSTTNGVTMASSGDTLSVNGILKSGGNAATIATGSIQSATSGGELVIRTNASADSLTIGSAITDNGGSSLTKAGLGTLTLTGTNTYTGGSYLSGGTVLFNNGSAFGTGTITSNGGIVIRNTAGVTTTNNLIVNGPTTLDVSGGNWTFNGNISGGGDIIRGTNAGLSLYLGGDNSGYTGTFYVPTSGNAVMRWTNVNAGSANARWVIDQGTSTRASIEFSGNGTIKFGSLTGVGFLTSANGGTKTIEVGNLNQDESFYGTLNQSGATTAVTKVGTGTWTLSGTNTYTGGTNLNDGAIQINNASALGTSGTISFGGGTLKYGTVTTDLSSRFSTADSQAYKVDTNGNDVTWASALTSSGGSLTKSGTGTLTLSGVNTYTGLTTISAGTLALGTSGSIAGGVNLGTSGSQGTLDLTAKSSYSLGDVSGYGAINIGTGKTVTIGGAFAPGNSPGAVSVTGSLTLGNGSTTNMEIAGTGVAGTNYDLISVSETLTYGGTLAITFLDSFTPSAGQSYNLFDSFTAQTGTFSFVTVAGTGLDALGDNSGFSGTANGLNYTFLYSSGDLTVSAIPEPSTYAAIVGALALAGVVWQRRRRRAA